VVKFLHNSSARVLFYFILLQMGEPLYANLDYDLLPCNVESVITMTIQRRPIANDVIVNIHCGLKYTN